MKYKKSSRGCCTIHESAKQDITPQIYTDQAETSSKKGLEMYICYNCNSKFAEPRKNPGEPIEFWGAYLRNFSKEVCPICGSGDIKYAKRCTYCGKVIELDDLYGEHYCIDCLEKLNTPENGVDYLKSKGGWIGKTGWIDFTFYELYGINDCDEMKQTIILIDREVMSRLISRDRHVIQKMHEYIAENYENFALWLSERGRKRE